MQRLIYDYLNKILNVDEKDILIAGGSIGSGACTHMGANRSPRAMIMISPFAKIKEVVYDVELRVKGETLGRFSNS